MDSEIDKFRELTAYHEASHLVVSLLCSLKLSKFNRPEAVTIRVVEGEPYGPNFVHTPPPIELKKGVDINADTVTQLFGSCFFLLSGYTSTKVFYNRGFHFISQINIEGKGNLTKETEINYISIDDQLDRADCVHDIEKVKERIEILFNRSFSNNMVDRNKLTSIITFITDQVYHLMNERPVKEAIEIVKDKLIARNTELIKDDEIKKLNKEIAPLLSKIDISKYLDKCRLAFENDDWRVEPTGGGIDFNLFG